MYEFRNCNSFL
jgi:20S proteasome subunit beta 2